MLWTTRDRSGTLATYLFFDFACTCAGVDVSCVGGLRDDSFKGGCGDQFLFPPVPFREDLGGGCTAKDTGMDQTGEFDAGDVTGGAVDAFEVPDRFGSIGIDFIQEPASIVFVEDTGEAPGVVLEWLDIVDLDEKNVTGFGVLNLEWAGQVVDLSQVDV